MRENTNLLLSEIHAGDFSAIARAITIVENELDGYETLLQELKNTSSAKLIGITGPPGAGKSTLVNSLIKYWLLQNKKIAVIAVDPSSPFNYGALLGDRIRMSDYYNHPSVFIRSLATRGALGGLNHKIIEISDILKSAPFDIILIETVGVGQSEVEISGLADCTIVALVPGAGDEVQTLKAGIMEIADIFVVNKADTDSAEMLYKYLTIMLHEKSAENEVPVLKTIATDNQGIPELITAIEHFFQNKHTVPGKKFQLLLEKCWQLIQAHKMKNIDIELLKKSLSIALQQPAFNIYSFTNTFLNK